jgi:hypothetical protein
MRAKRVMSANLPRTNTEGNRYHVDAFLTPAPVFFPQIDRRRRAITWSEQIQYGCVGYLYLHFRCGG